MATLTISLSGSAVVNGSKSYTLTDGDIQALIDWAKNLYDPYLQATYNRNADGTVKDINYVATNQQALLAWVQSWANGTRDAVQRFKTAAPVVPPPIVFS